MRHLVRTSSAAVALMLAVAAGCVSPERKPAVSAVGSLADTRAELVAGKGNIDEVVAATTKLQARPAKLEPVYEDYKSAVAAVERRADAIGTQVRDMRERSAEYRAKWSEENAQISDPSLRATADERRQRVAARYDAIDQHAQELRQAYDPFITQLRDVQTALANDLTYNGVAAAGSSLEKVRASATTLRGKVDALVAELDDTTMRLSPSTQPIK